MQILNPLFLLIFLGFLPYVFAYRKIRRRLPYSIILIVVTALLILSISDARVKLTDDKREFFVLIDNSPSMKRTLSSNSDRIYTLISNELGKLTSVDEVTLMSFSNEIQTFAKKIKEPDLKKTLEKLTWSTQNSTNLGNSIFSAITQFETPESAGMLVLTDGGVSDSLDALENSLLKTKLLGIKTKLLVPDVDEPKNTVILKIKSPQQVKANEAMIFNAKIHTNFNDSVRFNADFNLENGKTLSASTQLYFGETPLKPDGQGFYQLSANNVYNLYVWGVAPADANQVQCKINVESSDEIKSDNNAIVTCFVTSGKSVLIFTRNGKADFLSEFLTKNFPETKFVLQNPADAPANVENYLLHKLIIFSDANAESFGSNRNKVFAAIHDAVVNGGVNFAMCGGRSSFAPGGFYKSKIEEILPVSLDPNKDRKRAVALMLDRSESMISLIDSVTKISRVCSASVDFLDILKDEDVCTFISFSEKPDETGETVNLKKLDADYKLKIAERLGILGNSRNLLGRTNIEEALKTGIDKLEDRSEETKLLILFSDGEPTVGATKPEEFKDLIDEAKKSDVHVAFVIAGERSSLFDKLTENLGRFGNVEYLSENWQIDEAFRKALLNAGGKLIQLGDTAILNADKDIFVDSPALHGYVRTKIKDFNAAKALLMSEKHDPLVASWMMGSSHTSAIMLPFNDYDLFWETSVPRKVSGFLINHFKLLFEGTESEFQIQTDFIDDRVKLQLRDLAGTKFRNLDIVLGSESIDIKPVRQGIYEAEFELAESSVGKIVENNKTLMPVSFDIPDYQEFYDISGKSRRLKQIFVKYFGNASLNEKLSDRVISTQSGMYSLNKILLSLAILLIISWSILLAFKSRK